MKFEELEIPEAVRDGIRAAGFTECTPVQTMTLPEALRGKDIAAQAQTGTGKTAAFLIAVFSRMMKLPSPGRGSSPRVLIIAPTRELVAQIDAEARILSGSTGFRIASVFGGIDYVKQRNELAQGVDVLIGTPGRLIDYLKQRVYSLRKTQFLVIDEADRMFDMGFVADLRFLLRRMSPYDQRQSMLFSATLSYRVMELSHEFMNMPEKFVVTPDSVTVDLIEQQIYHVGKAEKFGLLLGMIRREPDGRYLIFSNMKVTAEKVQHRLAANGVAAAAITGDLPQRQRQKVLADFKDGKFPVLIATDVASRGLHIEGVTHVINYDLPQDPDDYVHRIGRTGRAGAGGKAISLASEDCVLSLPDIEDFIKQKIPVMPLTDDMFVTDYKKASPSQRKKGFPAGGKRPDQRRPGGGRFQATRNSTPAPDGRKTGPDKPRRRRRPGKQKPGAEGGA
ncbi:MAG TPA: DEAD/DEAH box helicase [Dissulfurispiraceae bacterium]|nr:DEAD/DEAH box helicase [Dissulfurispiraceae bacterium]